MCQLQAQCKLDRRSGCLEAEEAAITGPVDDAAPTGAGELRHEREMPCHQCRDGLVTVLRFQECRVRQVGENQRQDARARGAIKHAGVSEGMHPRSPACQHTAGYCVDRRELAPRNSSWKGHAQCAQMRASAGHALP